MSICTADSLDAPFFERLWKDSMNWLKGLIVVQTLILIALFYQVMQLSSNNSSRSNHGLQKPHVYSESQSTHSAVSTIPSIALEELSAIESSLLKQQIQLEQLSKKIELLANSSYVQSDLAANVEQRSTHSEKPATIEQNEQSQKLFYELDGFVQAGRISQRQLDELQFKAAKLSPAQKKQFFREIAQSVNSGAMSVQ